MNVFDNEKWGVHVHGPDSVLAAHSFEEAVEQCHRINQNIVRIKPEFNSRHSPLIWASVNLWVHLAPGTPHGPENTDWDEVC